MSAGIFARALHYQKRHGMAATVKRLGAAFQRASKGGGYVLYVCDLAALRSSDTAFGVRGEVKRNRSLAELAPTEIAVLEGVGHPGSIRRRMTERFALGATLWVFTMENHLAGYGWTLQGKTVVPHYFPLEANDVHLFDFYVFPEFRGRGINVALVKGILAALAVSSRGRAFIEAAEWNAPQLRSLSKMPFRCIGRARKVCLWGRPLVLWK